MSEEGEAKENSAATGPPDGLLELLGKVSDLQLHYRFNWPYREISELRRSLGVPVFSVPKPVPSEPVDNDVAPEWWTVGQAAQAWGVSKTYAWTLFRRLNGTVRIIDGRKMIATGTPKPGQR